MTVNTSMNRLLVASLLFLSISLISTEHVPVYIWESSKSSEAVPALPKINQETFKEIVQERLDKKSLVVVFAEPNLSSEDFTAVDDSGNKVFSNLPNIQASRTYLPSVDDPIGALNSVYSDEITQTTIKDFNVDDIKSSVLIIDLDDVEDNEDRNEILKRHDASISNIYEALQKRKGGVFAVYTGYHTSWISPEAYSLTHQTRYVLQASSKAYETSYAWMQDGFLLYVSDMPYLTIGPNRTNLNDHSAIVERGNNNTMAVTLQAAGTSGALFRFAFAGGYWHLTNVSVLNIELGNEIPLRVSNINAIEGFSFQCTNTVFQQREGTAATLSLPGMQLQVTTGAELTRFGDPLYCIGFTTAPIWSGIFVTAILATIMAIGLSMMMDIKTMDRFDDPKGKTIQINVSE